MQRKKTEHKEADDNKKCIKEECGVGKRRAKKDLQSHHRWVTDRIWSPNPSTGHMVSCIFPQKKKSEISSG